MRREAIYYGSSEGLQSKKHRMQKLRKTRTLRQDVQNKDDRNKEKKRNNSANCKINAILTKSPWSSSDDESAEEVEVLRRDGDVQKNKPFVLKCKFKKKPFHAFFDTGSPFTLFTEAHAGKHFRKAL